MRVVYAKYQDKWHRSEVHRENDDDDDRTKSEENRMIFFFFFAQKQDKILLSCHPNRVYVGDTTLLALFNHFIILLVFE